MTAINFYHLTTTPLEQALPKLLEKAYKGGFKTLVVTESDERVQRLNEWLWTYNPDSFLPHGSAADGHAEQQPILLSTTAIPANGASLLVITDGRTPETPSAFARIIDIFDGKSPQAVENARSRWALYKNASLPLTYHRQTPQGGWEQKAVA